MQLQPQSAVERSCRNVPPRDVSKGFPWLGRCVAGYDLRLFLCRVWIAVISLGNTCRYSRYRDVPRGTGTALPDTTPEFSAAAMIVVMGDLSKIWSDLTSHSGADFTLSENALQWQAMLASVLATGSCSMYASLSQLGKATQLRQG